MPGRQQTDLAYWEQPIYEQVMSQFSAQPRRAAAQITHSGVPTIDVQQIAIAVQAGRRA